MTLEEINEVEDKAVRLKLLREHVGLALQEQRDEDDLAENEDMNATRDEAHGMMSRFGKPGSD